MIVPLDDPDEKLVVAAALADGELRFLGQPSDWAADDSLLGVHAVAST